MRIHHVVAVIVLGLVLVGGSTHATKPIVENEYVKADELVATAARKLSPATADEMRKVFDGARPALFADEEPSGEKLVQIGAFFLADFIKPYVERNEIAKVRQFMQAVNQKKLVYGYRHGADIGCYVVDYSIEIKSVSTPSDEPGAYMVVTKKHYAGGLCKGLDQARKTFQSRMHIK